MIKVFFPPTGGLAAQGESASYTFGPNLPIYCLERPDRTWQVSQFLEDEGWFEGVAAEESMRNAQPATGARVSSGALYASRPGDPSGEAIVIESDEPLFNVRYPNDYLLGSGTVAFTYRGEELSCSSSEFWISTVPRVDEKKTAKSHA